MTQIEMNLFYGVRSLFNGLPIQESKLAVQFIKRVKKWKRLNRQSKIKTKTIEVPGMYKMGNIIVAHPKVVAKLRKQC